MKKKLLVILTLVAVIALAAVTANAACTHNYKNAVKKDGTYHTLTCTLCGATTTEKHGTSCKGTSGTCDICGATGVTTEQFHNNTSYLTDDNKHTHICDDCGVTLDPAEFHTVVNGTCVVCGETGLSQKVTSMSITNTSLKLELGSGALPTAQINVKLAPSTAENQNLSYVCSNTKVAKVSGGVVTGLTEGTCSIKVSTADGSGFSGTVNVTVTKKKVTAIKMSSASLNLQEKKTASLTATVTPADAFNPDITWSTSNSGVATIKDGVVTATGVGSCTITAAAKDGSGIKGTCKVTVYSGKVTAITLNSTNQPLALKTGSTVTFQLIPTVYPADAVDRAVIYTSSDPAVATVSSTGLVTAVAEGTCTIRVTAHDGNGATASCAITVKKPSVTSITLNTTSKIMERGTASNPTFQMKATVLPSTAADKSVVWKTSNKNVATVSDTGLITGVGVGTCTVTCTSKDGGASASVSVKIKPKMVSAITLNVKERTLGLKDGTPATFTLGVTVSPSDAVNKGYTYSTSDATVATVDERGLVTGMKPGKATITVTAKDGSGKKATCVVTVTSSKIDAIKLNTYSKVMEITAKTPAPTFQMRATVVPTSAATERLTWTSSNEKVCTVSATGLIIGKGPGTATVTVSNSNGAVKAVCNVKIKRNDVQAIKLNTNSKIFVINPKKAVTFQLKATVTPTDAGNSGVNWSSSNAKVATVSGTGMITVRGVGTCVITAAARDGSGVKATCSVKVKHIQITGLKLNASSKIIPLKAGKTVTFQLKPTVTAPKNATCKTLKWTSSNDKVAKVDQNGLVTMVAPGTCTITVAATDGSGLKASCSFKVKVQPMTSIKLDKTSATLTIGTSTATCKIKATTAPADATYNSVVWSSSDSTVATVSKDGTVTAVNYGTCTIYAKAADGLGAVATCAVTVK